MDVEIICPLYNASDFVKKLDGALKRQKNVKITKISYILTESKDNTKEILDSISANYSIIKPEEFSHSLTREKVAMRSQADIVVFITQDIEIESDNWLENLIKPIEKGEVVASYSRQISKYNNIEKYTREKNYPENSRIKSSDDLEDLGLNTFFFSDASSATRTDIFRKLNGYDAKDFPTNEDMYFAYKLITGGYKIKYCADSIVYHSHKFSMKQLYKRYYDTGVFFRQNKYLNNYGTNKSGTKLAKYILNRCIEEKNIKNLIEFLPNMAVRFLGMKIGSINGRK